MDFSSPGRESRPSGKTHGTVYFPVISTVHRLENFAKGNVCFFCILFVLNHNLSIMDKISCQVCSTFFCASVPSMFRHLEQVHQNDPGLHVTCDVLGCQRSFTKVRAKHL